MVRQKLILAAVAGHLLLTALHGLVHVAISVFPTGWTAAFAVVSLYLLPIVGAGLVALAPLAPYSDTHGVAI